MGVLAGQIWYSYAKQTSLGAVLFHRKKFPFAIRGNLSPGTMWCRFDDCNKKMTKSVDLVCSFLDK